MRVAVKLLLIFVLVFAGVKIWYGRLEERLRVPAAVSERTVEKPAVVRTEIERKPDDYSIIVDRNIFQAAITVAEEKEEAPQEELTPTKLKLSLMGTIFGTERESRAIIADDLKKQQDIYQVGDSIQGALIKLIERGRVVLEVNGADEELLLKDREGGGPAYEPSPADLVQEAEPPPEPTPEPMPEPEPVVVEPVEPAPVQMEPQPLPENPVPNQPVRPRPLRRPLRMQGGSDGTPDAGVILNVDEENIHAKGARPEAPADAYSGVQ